MLNLGFLSGLGCGCEMRGLGDLGELGHLSLGELGAMHAQTALQRKAAAQAAAQARQIAAQAKHDEAESKRRAKAAAAAEEKLRKTKLTDINKAINQIKPHMALLQTDPAGQPWVVYYNCLTQVVSQINAGQSAQTCTGPGGTIAQAVKTINDLKHKATQDAHHAAAIAKQAVQKQKVAEKKEEAEKKKQARIETAAQKKDERKAKRVAGRNVKVPKEEEKKVDTMSAGFEAFKKAAQAAMSMSKNARTPEQKRAAAQAIQAAMAMVNQDVSTLVAAVGKPQAKKMIKKANMRGLGYIGPDGIEYQDPDPNTALPIDGAGGGMDPMMQMMMAQLNKPVEMPKQCQKNPNKPICQFYTLSQQSQQQMSFLITMVMQMQQQLMATLQQLLAGGPVTGGGEFYPPPTEGGMPGGYPPPTGYPPEVSSGYPGGYPGDAGGGFAPMPTGGAMAPGGVDQIPAGFDVGGGGGGADVIPGGGSDAFIPQDIPMTGGGTFAPAPTPQETYAPAQSYNDNEMPQDIDAYGGGGPYGGGSAPQYNIQQEYNIVESGNVPPQVFIDESIIPEQGELATEIATRASIPQGVDPEGLVAIDQEPVEMATAGAKRGGGPSQGDIQNMYFETEGSGRDDGF